MKITIRHQMSFPAGNGGRMVAHLLLTPASGPTQTVERWSIAAPGIENAARFVDAFANRAVLVAQARSEADFVIRVEGEVETQDRNGVLGRVTGEPVVALYRRVTPETGPDPRLLVGLSAADGRNGKRIELFHRLMGRVRELYDLHDDETPQGTPDEAAPEAGQQQSPHGQSQRHGAAPDAPPGADPATLSHSFIGALRALDIPARYVTGYFAGDDDQAAGLHAWAEAHDDSLGWIGFDMLLGICPTDRHVRLAVGLDAQSSLPVRMVPQADAAATSEAEVTAQ